MKKITLIALLAFSGAAFAQGSANATANSAAEIVEPITIQNVRNLNFGRIIGGSAGGGIVSVSATETATRNINTELSAPGGTISSAKFTITASDNTYSIAIDATDLTAEGLTTMPFSPTPSITESTSGDQTLFVGGDLTVGATQESGTYAGEVKVTVSYE